MKTLNDDRYWTQRKGVSPTARGGSLRMSGGSSILYTVRTRDGTFLIAHGRITRAVKNLRFDDSPVFMLNHLEALGTPVRVGASEDGGPGQAVMVPRITVRDFTFTSSSDAA